MEVTTSKTLVMIVTYNGMKWLERCLDSIVNSSIPLDAYIVDNGSTDGSQQFITANYPQFTFYQSPTNSGFGAANNIGLKYAIEQNYDYVYLLNQDAWVMPDTIDILIGVNKNNPEYGILSPLQTNAERTKLDNNFAGCIARNREAVSDYTLGNLKDVYDVNFVMAAHWLVSKECFMTVGEFSPIFYHYGEDDNYQYRVKYFGYKVGIVPSVMAVHDREHRRTTKKKDVYMLTPFFLGLACNINESFFNSILRAYFDTLRYAISITRRHKDLFILFRVFPMIFKICEIYKVRQYTKKSHI